MATCGREFAAELCEALGLEGVYELELRVAVNEPMTLKVGLNAKDDSCKRILKNFHLKAQPISASELPPKVEDGLADVTSLASTSREYRKLNEECSVRYVGEMQRLQPKPGDVYVVTSPHPLSDQSLQNIKDRLVPMLGGEVVVLGDGMQLGCIGASERQGAQSVDGMSIEQAKNLLKVR